MYRFKKPNLDTQQWALYSLLVVSLGFNLSMNPEHFYKFARNEMKTPGHTELAQTAASARTKDMGEVEGKLGRFKVTVVEIDSVTVAKFQKVEGEEASGSDTTAASPATDCALCLKPVVLSNNIDAVIALSVELNDLVNDSKAQEQAKSEKTKTQKAGEALEADLEAYAKKCASYEDDEDSESRLNCHKNQLVALSKFLKNSKETQSIVLDYFKQYVQGDLQRAFRAKTVKQNEFGNYDQDSSALEFAQQLSEELISSLRPQNGSATVRAISKLNSNAYLYQLQNAQDLIRKGEQSGNMYMVRAGMMGMSPFMIRSLLENQHNGLTMAIDGMPGRTSADMIIKDYLTNDLRSTFYNPVNTTLVDLERYMSPQSNTNGQSPRSLADFVITSSPYLMNDSIVSTNPGDHQLAMDIILGRNTFRGNQHALLWSSNPGGIPTPMVTPNYNQTPSGEIIPAPAGVPLTPGSARSAGRRF
jgi:hypothetical protein